MINLYGNQTSIDISFPSVHLCAELKVTLKRTLKLPDDGKDYGLTPGLGDYALEHVRGQVASVLGPEAPGDAAGVATFGAVTKACAWTELKPTKAYPAAGESVDPATGLMTVTLASDPAADGWRVATVGAPGADTEALFSIGHFYAPFGASMGLCADAVCGATWSGGEGLTTCDYQDPHSAGAPLWGTAPLRVVGFYVGFDAVAGLNRVVPATAAPGIGCTDPVTCDPPGASGNDPWPTPPLAPPESPQGREYCRQYPGAPYCAQ